ncbi:MAG TPA: hypothetical protein VIJ62_10770 [Rhizomicrobium sp.]
MSDMNRTDRVRPGTLLVGLHITKCAGTTLASHVKSHLPAKAWYLCSAFRDTQMSSCLEFFERSNFDALRFIFGHYIHESIFSAFGEREIFLFTGMRAPVDRAVSEYFQICRVRARAGLLPISVDEFFAIRKDTMCREILRAFPSLAQGMKGSLAAKAIQICQMFDLIYETQTFSTSVSPLLKLVSLDAGELKNQNTRDSKNASAGADIEKAIRERAPQYFDQDHELFEFLKPHFGRLHPFRGEYGNKSAYRKRKEIELRAIENGLYKFAEHLARHFVADYRNLGQLTELDELLTRKQVWVKLLLEKRMLLTQQPK